MFINQFPRWVHQIISWFIGGFLLFTPFLLYGGYLYTGSASRSITMTFVMGVSAVVVGGVLLFQKGGLRVMKSPILIGLFIYFALLIVSMFSGVDPSTSFWSKATRTTGIFYLSHLGVFYLALVYLFSDESHVRPTIRAFLVGAVVFSIGYLIGPDGFGWIFADKPWDGFTFVNSSFAAMYLYGAFMLSIYYVFSLDAQKRKWWQYIVPVLLVINPAFINPIVWKGDFSGGIMGEAFASAYAVLFSIVYLVVVFGVSKLRSYTARKNTTIALSVVGLLVVAFASGSLITKDGLVERWYRSQSSLARPIVWNLSKQAIAERPLFGWGTDNFEKAYIAHYDNSVLEPQNGAEPWFDRAHNVLIDQAVDTGYVGVAGYVALYLVIIGALLVSLFRVRTRHDQVLAVVVLGYFIFHFAELQTAFDTSISYIPFAFMTSLATVVVYRGSILVHSEREQSWNLGQAGRTIVGIVLVGYFGWALFSGTIPIMKAQNANGMVRTVGSAEKRLPLYDALFSSPLDLPSFLWRTSTDFQRGIAEKPAVLSDPKKVASLVKELDVFSKQYEQYLEKNPNDFRAYASLADIYIYYKLFDIDKLDKAHETLDKALEINPDFPQVYRMKAVAYLYQAKFKDAREWAQKALAINPNVDETKRLVDYIDRSIKDFPNIELFFFKQI